MTDQQMQSEVDQLLCDAGEAIKENDWNRVRLQAEIAVAIDPGNEHVNIYLMASESLWHLLTAHVSAVFKTPRRVLDIAILVVALTYAAAYLGIASGAYELAAEEMARAFPSGARRLDIPVNQRRIAEMHTQIEAARALLHAASSAFDQGRASSNLPYFQAKVSCAEAAVRVTQDLMTIFGGTAFAGRLPFERYFRDARAGIVMGMANDTAYQNMVPLLFPPGQ